jgi:dolichyl-phosphate beta-glucosyltransferase
MYLSIIIPAYNEENRIGKTLDAIYSYLKTKTYTWEILVIDNGSRDGTRALVEEYRQKMPGLTLITRESHGKGWAVKQGMLAAQGEYRLFTDADNSTDITQLDKLLPYATHGADVVISSRKMEGAVIDEKQPWYRVWLGKLFPLLVKMLVPHVREIKDTQNGFKLFSARAAEKIFAHQTIYYWAFDVEILALADIFGFKVKEVPIVWVNDDQSKMNLKGMLRAAFEVLLTRFHLLTFDYAKLKRARGGNYKLNPNLYGDYQRESVARPSA